VVSKLKKSQVSAWPSSISVLPVERIVLESGRGSWRKSCLHHLEPEMHPLWPCGRFTNESFQGDTTPKHARQKERKIDSRYFRSDAWV